MRRGERGSATLVAVIVCGVVVVLSLALAEATILAGDRVAAQTAADAAALAAAPATFPALRSGAPEDAARRFAAANGARLVACECRVESQPVARTVRVVVERIRDVPLWGRVAVRAGASAEFDPLAALDP